MHKTITHHKFISVVFTVTIFLSAALLFFVQPLFAKIVLPEIGGAPAVWTTAMLFFQSVLLIGYVYAHMSSRYLPISSQLTLHISLWVVALTFLPLGVPEDWHYDPELAAAPQTLLLFAVGVGLPFAVLSANAPLIQSWYGRSDGPSANDPYFLYGASNLGSLLALLAFPLVAEPLLGSLQIGIAFAAGFALLGAFLFASGMFTWAGKGKADEFSEPALRSPEFKEYVTWITLAFVPSSLMLSVTTKISTDLGSMPLVWVIPLSLYLLTFVIAFSRHQFIGPRAAKVAGALAIAISGVLFSDLLGAHLSINQAALLIISFFVLALWAHYTLYQSRPNSEYLTLFYVTMSVGGALGGLFNSIIAPIIFSSVYEGIVTVAVASMMFILPALKFSARAVTTGAVIGIVGGVLFAGISQQLGTDYPMVKMVCLLAMIIGAFIIARKSLTSAGVASIAISLTPFLLAENEILFEDRSFFGTHRVYDAGGLRVYTNGTTIHGAQRLRDLDALRPEPIAYYHRNGPLGQILTARASLFASRVGIVGLGIGALSCYAQPAQEWHFYEIDELVDRIARDKSLFTFMSSCAVDAPTHLGDARVVLENQNDMRFDVLIIDAYSSDSVPVHLTTREAVETYMSHLTDDGILLFHISNRYYEIWRPLSRTSDVLELVAWQQKYPGNQTIDPDDFASEVVAVAKSTENQFALDTDTRWSRLESDGGRVWTDDRANLLSILNWSRE